MEDTLECLLAKHPVAQPMHERLLLQGLVKKVNAVIFDCINVDLVRICALSNQRRICSFWFCKDSWRKIIGGNVYGLVSDDLCHAIARMTCKICSRKLKGEDLSVLAAYCRFIPLKKSPGLRPIGIDEVLRRVMEKAVMQVVKQDVVNVTQCEQSCAGIEAGCEAALHVVANLFQEDEIEGFVQIDASNAFNTINRAVLLHNSKVVCPEIATYLSNFYSEPERLFFVGGKEIASREGTTQGDAVAMAMYAIELMPLLMPLSTTDLTGEKEFDPVGSRRRFDRDRHS